VVDFYSIGPGEGAARLPCASGSGDHRQGDQHVILPADRGQHQGDGLRGGLAVVVGFVGQHQERERLTGSV